MQAYLFGLTLAFAVGPMALLIVQRAIMKGTMSAVATAFGIAIADFTYALVACIIGTSVLQFIDSYNVYVHLFSAIVLLILAIHVFNGALQKYRHGTQTKAAHATGRDFLSAYLLTLHNPMTVAVFLGFLGYMTDIRSLPGITLFACMLFLGSCTGQLLIALSASGLRGFFKDPRSIFALNTISSIGIACFAADEFGKVMVVLS